MAEQSISVEIVRYSVDFKEATSRLRYHGTSLEAWLVHVTGAVLTFMDQTPSVYSCTLELKRVEPASLKQKIQDLLKWLFWESVYTCDDNTIFEMMHPPRLPESFPKHIEVRVKGSTSEDVLKSSFDDEYHGNPAYRVLYMLKGFPYHQFSVSMIPWGHMEGTLIEDSKFRIHLLVIRRQREEDIPKTLCALFGYMRDFISNNFMQGGKKSIVVRSFTVENGCDNNHYLRSWLEFYNAFFLEKPSRILLTLHRFLEHSLLGRDFSQTANVLSSTMRDIYSLIHEDLENTSNGGDRKKKLRELLHRYYTDTEKVRNEYFELQKKWKAEEKLAMSVLRK